jgi:hypothetical protein
VRPDPREELIHMLTGLADLGLREQVEDDRPLAAPREGHQVWQVSAE